MADAMLTCPEHGTLLVPDATDGTRLVCPDGDCFHEFRFAGGPAFPSPLTPLGEGAAAHHELVLTYQAAGFTRTEAMQVLCCVISASMMKDKGSG